MSNDPSQFPSHDPHASPPQQPFGQPSHAGQAPAVRSGIPVWTVLLIVGAVGFFMLMVCGILLALLLPAVQAAREAARRANCVNNMKVIGIALHNYHDTYGSFPPAYVTDEEGQPMHSWRALLLPFLDEGGLAGQYHFDEPWNGPNNRLLEDKMPAVYGCPSETPESGMTSYLAVVGPETIWPGPTGTRIREITDGTSNTIAIVEAAGSRVNWLEPRDLTLDEAARGINRGNYPGIASDHPYRANVGFCDASVIALEEEISPEVLRALLTKAGGEEVRLPR